MPGRTPQVLGLLVLSLAGCAEPFEETRQDLASFRIAALRVQDGMAVAAVWSGEGLYHSTAPRLAWTLNDQDIGEGWDVPVQGYGTLGLTATAADGTERQAVLSVHSAPEDQLTVSREAVDLGGELDLEARRELTGEPVEGSVAAGSGVRLSVDNRRAEEALRWMLGGGEGTLLELDDDRADLLREEVQFEDGDVASREDLGPGRLHALVLGLDGVGGNRWLWADAAVGVDDGLARHEGRLVTLGGAASAGWLAVTLTADEGLAGVAFTDAVGVSDLAEQEVLDCAMADTPFRLAWVAEGRCPLPEVLGARVVVEVW